VQRYYFFTSHQVWWILVIYPSNYFQLLPINNLIDIYKCVSHPMTFDAPSVQVDIHNHVMSIYISWSITITKTVSTRSILNILHNILVSFVLSLTISFWYSIICQACPVVLEIIFSCSNSVHYQLWSVPSLSVHVHNC